MNKKYISICMSVVLLCVVFTLFVAFFTGKDTTDKTEKPVDGEVSVQAQEGNYSLTITAVYDAQPQTDEKNPPKAQRVAVVVYEYKNADISHGLSIVESHFKAYDSAGKELEIYPQKGLFEPSEVSESGTFTASVAFALNNSDNYLKIKYFNDISSKTADAEFEQTW